MRKQAYRGKKKSEKRAAEEARRRLKIRINAYRRKQRAKETMAMEEKVREGEIASKIVRNLKSRLEEGLASKGEFKAAVTTILEKKIARHVHV